MCSRWHRHRSLICSRPGRDSDTTRGFATCSGPRVRSAKREDFLGEYAAIRELPGIGDYTAAAIASIAFGLPHAVLDGNVMRVLARVTAEPGDIRRASRPASGCRRWRAICSIASVPASSIRRSWNSALRLCVPADPKCLLCPVASYCEARKTGREREFPIKSRSGGSGSGFGDSAGGRTRWPPVAVAAPAGEQTAGGILGAAGHVAVAGCAQSARASASSATASPTRTTRLRFAGRRSCALRDYTNGSPSRGFAEMPLSTTARKALRTSAIL